MYPPFIFAKYNGFFDVMVLMLTSDVVTTTEAIKRVTDKMFKCFDTSISTRDS